MRKRNMIFSWAIALAFILADSGSHAAPAPLSAQSVQQINYLLARTATLSKYNDAGAYADGTGGTASALSYTFNATTPLNSPTDLKISKSASDATGMGITILSQTIPKGDRGKTLWLKFDWDGSASNYVTNDVQVFAYDVTNGEIIPVSAIAGATPDTSTNQPELPKSQTEVTLAVYPKSTTAQIRISLHWTTDGATASAYDLFLGKQYLAPMSSVPAFMGTDWTSYTGCWTASGSTTIGNGTVNCRWRRVGDEMEIDFYLGAGSTTSGSGTYRISLPTGYSIDTTKRSNASPQDFNIGSASFHDTGTAVYFGTVNYVATTYVHLSRWNAGGSTVDTPSGWTSTAPMTLANGDEVFARFSVPIVGWRASAAVSSTEVNLSGAKVIAQNSAGTSFADNTLSDVPFATELVDTHNAFDGTTFTAPSNGTYIFTLRLSPSLTAVSSTGYYCLLANSANTQTGLFYQTTKPAINAIYQCNGSLALKMSKGETAKVRFYHADGGSRSLQAVATNNSLEIIQQPDLSVFSAFGLSERQYDCTFSGPAGYSANGTPKCIPYLTADGAWRTKFNVDFTLTSATSISLTAPFTCKNSSAYQAVTCWSISSAQTINYARCDPNSSTITINFASGSSRIICSGDVELNAKPSFVP